MVLESDNKQLMLYNIIKEIDYDVNSCHIHKLMHTQYIHTYIHTYIYTYIRTYIYSYVHIYIYTYVRKYIHTRTYIHTHTYGGWNFNSGNYLFTTDTKKIHVSKFYCPSM